MSERQARFGKECENCKYTGVQITRWPCKTCGPFMKHFTPLKTNYGSCQNNHLSPDGDCGVYAKTWPCIQWDCCLWGNEPAKVDDMDRLMNLIREYATLAAKYDNGGNEAQRQTWLNDIRPAVWGLIEARARAAFEPLRKTE